MAEQGGEDEAELRSTDASATEGTVVERTSLGMETTWCTNHHLGSNLQRGLSRKEQRTTRTDAQATTVEDPIAQRRSRVW
ncbi:hypothetical protein ACFXTH_035957 [Malus domestica]